MRLIKTHDSFQSVILRLKMRQMRIYRASLWRFSEHYSELFLDHKRLEILRAPLFKPAERDRTQRCSEFLRKLKLWNFWFGCALRLAIAVKVHEGDLGRSGTIFIHPSHVLSFKFDHSVSKFQFVCNCAASVFFNQLANHVTRWSILSARFIKFSDNFWRRRFQWPQTSSVIFMILWREICFWSFDKKIRFLLLRHAAQDNNFVRGGTSVELHSALRRRKIGKQINTRSR